MKGNHCSCGDVLVTRDEITRAACWHCAGLSQRLLIMDSELAALKLPQPPSLPRSLPLAA